MGLVDYSDSDSEGSDTEVKPTPKPAAINKKPAFQKLTSSSTGKIQVSLPTSATNDDSDSRPAKRTKIGAGAFSGFNSFLPPPKKTGAASLSLPAPKATNGGASENAVPVVKRVPITLKGAGPAFSRSRGDEYDEERSYDDMGASITTNGGGVSMSLPPPKGAPQPVAQGKPAEEVKMVGLGKPMQFKPLSVGRKVVKKKKKTVDELRPAEVEKPKGQAPILEAQPAAPLKPQGRLFSVPGDDEDDEPVAAATTSGKYEPMIYGAHMEQEQDGTSAHEYPHIDTYDPTSYASAHQTSYTQSQVPAQTTTSSLSDIASDLHLSASERRQLFGRNGSQRQAANVKNFNMDAEYRHNEEVRASGETVTHNPVRAIAPGKHSLQQLVSQVQNQKEALEESFQKGYANRREASSRYGW